MRVEDKVAIVTGASAGIGKSIAIMLAKEGAKVILTDIKETEGKQVVDMIKGQNGEATFIHQDVSKDDEWKKVTKIAEETYGKVDILVNNAGVYMAKSVGDTTLDDWDFLMDINVKGTFLGMKHILPLMRKHQSGSIINMSSVAGLNGSENHSLYCASKGAVRLMTKAVAAEAGTDKIRVNSVHPGLIVTEMGDDVINGMGITVEDFAQGTLLKRAGNTNDIAQIILYLASDESTYVTAQEMVVDGGLA
ncbi:glucose 1-dehydrogenase [Virgibacillus sp. NKC19-3]|uniref:SDR family NAD(P)-dependent oxidoreductase n=1 Tax=Virgibacillus saliphilus TaxID=2831674 RepID=UPI001C9A4413|nr:glucose 1-dehydrogenase [Virgibacillus sp. NKC19-3]MBY7143179.1 glucose 1-dehydrogenase [Virgibacillus sp. NKC19-3]